MGLIEKSKSRKYILEQLVAGYRKLGMKYVQLISLIVINFVIKNFRKRTFRFMNRKYRYFYHPYNHTWVNERTVEVPIILDQVLKEKGEVLEIGNVLKHYYPLKHDVLDKYEVGPGIINQDVVDCKLNKKYDLIVSISTMEHVGWDEKIKDPDKIPHSIQHLKKFLKAGGKMIITVPIKYNPFLDKHIDKKSFFNGAYFLKRGIFNRWKEVNWDKAKNLNYAREISARGLAIIIVNK